MEEPGTAATGGRRWRRALLGLGSNLGDRLGYLRSAVKGLAEVDGVRVEALSPVYESPPMGPVAQGHFLNAAVMVETRLTPAELLAAAVGIEAAHGRERRVRWGPRTVDIDLLWMAGVEVAEPGLQVPHPEMAKRAFVLRPAADIMPDLVLADGRTLSQAVKELSDDACVRVPGAELGWRA